jgi:hypothetical protein
LSVSFTATALSTIRRSRSCVPCSCRLGGPAAANGRDPAVGWALGTIFPEFDDLARPIQRRINHAAVAALPISFRPALLAGVSQTITNPDTLNAVWDETILRGEEHSNAINKSLGGTFAFGSSGLAARFRADAACVERETLRLRQGRS